MSVVARAVLRERVETYLARNPDATLPEVLGRFLLDPDLEPDGDGENEQDGRHEERALVEDVLAAHARPTADTDGFEDGEDAEGDESDDAPRDAVEGATGGARA